MLAEKDLRQLRGISEPAHRFAVASLAFLAALHVYLAFQNFLLAFDYARVLGLDFFSTLQMWNSEPALSKAYSGYEVQSLHRLNMAILQVGMVILFSMWTISLVSKRAYNKRVLAAFESMSADKGAKGAQPSANSSGYQDRGNI